MEPTPYSQIAPVYDILMEEVDYQAWVFYIKEVLEKNGIVPPARILDLACGTGTTTLMLRESGFKAIGLDLSREMLEQARLKAGFRNSEVDWIWGDMKRFRLGHKVDATICLFDSVNYLTKKQELLDCFSCVRETLRPGGMFVFDMNTIHALSTNWGNATKVYQDSEVHSIWRSIYHPCERIAVLEMTIFQPDGKGGYRKLQEVHVERGYEMSEIDSCLRQAGFGEVQIYEHGTYEPPGANTGRVMITAKA